MLHIVGDIKDYGIFAFNREGLFQMKGFFEYTNLAEPSLGLHSTVGDCPRISQLEDVWSST